MNEEVLRRWTAPSSNSEKDKQERTERMVRAAVTSHRGFAGVGISVFAKGSYPNSTNVRLESDVDIAVQCHERRYRSGTESGPVATKTLERANLWTPAHLRAELVKALEAQFGGEVDTSGHTAIGINSSTAPVDADVVPCFDYRHTFDGGSYRDGILVTTTDSRQIHNYPKQCLDEGVSKNVACSMRFKKLVRILKRCAISMENEGVHAKTPSFFVESLVFNCPNTVFEHYTWTERARAAIYHIWSSLEGDEPSAPHDRWVEVNRAKYLFHSGQEWTRAEGSAFARAAWNYLELAQ